MARWFVDRLPQKGIPSVSLRRLLPEAQFIGCPDWEVSGCTADSRRLDPGQVFVAVRGARVDGHAFVGQALERGASGVIVERPCPGAGPLQAVVPDTRVALARLCQALAGDPARQLNLLGVTGTCGKGATSLFLRSIYEVTGARMGLVGLREWSDGVTTHPGGRPVPQVESLAVMLAAMVDRRCAGAVLEVASEALELRRLEGLEFGAAVVTDLGGPLGWRANDLVERRRHKARLLRQVVPGGAAVVNADDPHAEILGAGNLGARLVTYSMQRPADVTAHVERANGGGSRFTLRGFDREATVNLRLVGPNSVSHALAAAAVAWSRGLPVESVVAGLEAVTGIPGRMEAVREGQAFEVRIDQARTGVTLQDALAALRSIVDGKIHCVIGAEGNQDWRVRHALASAAENGADRVILTSNNPRTEDPNQIYDDLLAGFYHAGRVRIETDRRRAIETALGDARPGDGVLIAGKGEQTYQILSDRAVAFSDREVAVEWLRSHRKAPTRSTA
jgi:UDP-N-acetylmuramoyl-L-alanyl-D-glutamate--2,6-diaminopimelate ligase